MEPRHVLRCLPGVIATLLTTVVATAAAVTGTASLFYEGWGQPLPVMLRYLAPAAVLMAAGLIALRWPRAAAALLVTIGVGAGAWWLSVQTRRSMASLDELVITALLMTQPVILAGLLYLFEARHRRLLREECLASSRLWIARNWRPLWWSVCRLRPR